MRLVLGGESLFGQLTGIGQYTQQLSRHLLALDGVSELQFLALGRLYPSQALLDPALGAQDSVPAPADPDTPYRSRHWLAAARRIAARSRLAVAAYERLAPLAERRALRQFRADDVFHSPNYLLPPFPGKRVVSILDLSTCRFPEFHPPARVALVNRHIERAVQRADHIITISHLVRDEIIERFALAEDRISVTYLAADARFAPVSASRFASVIDREYPRSRARPMYRGYFLFAGSVEPRKNLSRLLDAYLAYRAQVGEADAMPLILTGIAGWKSDDLHARLRALGDQGCVHYLGYIAPSLLTTLMAGARALLFPSIYEGFGLPALEAMQCGTPVMTSRGSAMAEFAGSAVLPVSADDSEDMAAAIQRLHTDGDRVEQLTAAGLSRAADFSWARCAQQTLDVYRQL